jgi:HD-GYP domain-containing protein (c-di-GMP phosphodiesterase class II)
MAEILQQQEKQLKVLQKISQLMVCKLSLPAVLRAIVDLVVEATGGDACLIYLIESNEMVLYASNISHPSEIGRLRLKMGEGLTGWVAKERRMVAIPTEASLDPRFRRFHTLPEDTFNAFLSTPIISRDEIVGVINVQHCQPHAHTDAEIEMLHTVGEQVGCAIVLARLADEVKESQAHLDQATLEFVETMSQALDARDPYTAGHSDRVSANSTVIAEKMGLSPREIEIIRIGAKLHDIGKIGIPDAVLQKPGRLTSEELLLIRLHPQIGRKILEKVGRFHDYLPIVELHHEDYDGGGYPYGLKGDAVPIGVRIVHLVDVYDAITSNRAYRAAMPEGRVLEILTGGAGTIFDPVIVEVFLTILKERKILQEFLKQASGTVTPAILHESNSSVISSPKLSS